MANPVTMKTFLPNEGKIGDLTVFQYVARLATEAVTIINAEDYGRAIYDLATRRALIGIGEDMVNVAYDAPVDNAPQEQIEDAERRLSSLLKQGATTVAFRHSRMRLLPPWIWRTPLSCAMATSPVSPPGFTCLMARWAACSLPT